MVRLELRVLDETMVFESSPPPEHGRLDALLPMLRKLDDALIGVAVREVEKQGESISCRKGCSTCCRAQPVPISPPETYALLRLVEGLPEPRRSEVQTRFSDAVQRLREAGLYDPYMQRDPSLSSPEARAIAERYFGLGIVCPFLSDDACGIYAERPFVCRQYLVTSPAELCRDPFHEPVRPVQTPATPTSAALGIGDELFGVPQYTVPLILALEYAQKHRAVLERTFDLRPVAPRWIARMCHA
jgi:Fe-S-cluster containining protein